MGFLDSLVDTLNPAQALSDLGGAAQDAGHWLDNNVWQPIGDAGSSVNDWRQDFEDTEGSLWQDRWDMFKRNPTSLAFALTPAQAKFSNKLLGTEFKPYTDQYGGPTREQTQNAYDRDKWSSNSEGFHQAGHAVGKGIVNYFTAGLGSTALDYADAWGNDDQNKSKLINQGAKQLAMNYATQGLADSFYGDMMTAPPPDTSLIGPVQPSFAGGISSQTASGLAGAGAGAIGGAGLAAAEGTSIAKGAAGGAASRGADEFDYSSLVGLDGPAYAGVINPTFASGVKEAGAGGSFAQGAQKGLSKAGLSAGAELGGQMFDSAFGGYLSDNGFGDPFGGFSLGTPTASPDVGPSFAAPDALGMGAGYNMPQVPSPRQRSSIGGYFKDLAPVGMGAYGLYHAHQLAKLANPTGAQGAARGQLEQLVRDPSSLTRQPGWQAGQQAVQRSQAANGYLGSGNMAAALQNYGGDFYNKTLQTLSQLGAPTPDQYQAKRDSLNLTGQSLNSMLYGGSRLAKRF